MEVDRSAARERAKESFEVKPDGVLYGPGWRQGWRQEKQGVARGREGWHEEPGRGACRRLRLLSRLRVQIGMRHDA